MFIILYDDITEKYTYTYCNSVYTLDQQIADDDPYPIQLTLNDDANIV